LKIAAEVPFLCPHNAAKGVIAAAYFNRLAEESRLDLRADSAGTEPGEKVAPRVVGMLANEGIDVSGHRPRGVTSAGLRTADRIVSTGCTPAELGVDTEGVDQWSDLPAVSEDAEGERGAIRKRIEQMIREMVGGA
jgi:protein-tyrosine-phosphatase